MNKLYFVKDLHSLYGCTRHGKIRKWYIPFDYVILYNVPVLCMYKNKVKKPLNILFMKGTC